MPNFASKFEDESERRTADVRSSCWVGQGSLHVKPAPLQRFKFKSDTKALRAELGIRSKREYLTWVKQEKRRKHLKWLEWRNRCVEWLKFMQKRNPRFEPERRYRHLWNEFIIRGKKPKPLHGPKTQRKRKRKPKPLPQPKSGKSIRSSRFRRK